MEGNLVCEITCLAVLLFAVSDILLSYAAVEGVMRTQDGQITGKPRLLPLAIRLVIILTHTCAPQPQVIRVNMALLLATNTEGI